MSPMPVIEGTAKKGRRFPMPIEQPISDTGTGKQLPYVAPYV
jgi:hypothetical protein